MFPSEYPATSDSGQILKIWIQYITIDDLCPDMLWHNGIVFLSLGVLQEIVILLAAV